MKFVHFKCVPLKHALGGPDSIGVELDSNGEKTIIPIEVVAGMMIEHLCMIAAKNTAEITDNNTQDVQQFFPRNLVVAIPSYYTEAQRRALLHGCNFVGIRGIKKLIHENTAVALEYGLYKDYRNELEEGKQTNVMFIDMGASCYTVTIAAFETGKLTIKSAHYDTDLGGRNFDLVIANWLSDRFNGVSDHPHDDPKVMFKFLAAAERAKKTLSQKGVKEAFINMEHLTENWDFHVMLKASDYEKMCAPLIARLEGPIKKTLEEAKLTSKDLASVEIVGGGSRIGFVREKIQEILDVSSLATTLDAGEAVARGAAYQAAILPPRFRIQPYEIVDFHPFPVMASLNEEKTVRINDNGNINDHDVNDNDVNNNGKDVNYNRIDVNRNGVEDNDVNNNDKDVNDNESSKLEISCVLVTRGIDIPILRRVTCIQESEFKLTMSYDKSASAYGELEEGYTENICSWVIKVPSGDGKRKILVTVNIDNHGIFKLHSAQMIEEKLETEKVGDEANEKKIAMLRKTNLEYTATRPLDWSKEEIVKFREAQVRMAIQQDCCIVPETPDAMKNIWTNLFPALFGNYF